MSTKPFENTQNGENNFIWCTARRLCRANALINTTSGMKKKNAHRRRKKKTVCAVGSRLVYISHSICNSIDHTHCTRITFNRIIQTQQRYLQERRQIKLGVLLSLSLSLSLSLFLSVYVSRSNKKNVHSDKRDGNDIISQLQIIDSKKEGI